jgi:hypothetical protein
MGRLALRQQQLDAVNLKPRPQAMQAADAILTLES